MRELSKTLSKFLLVLVFLGVAVYLAREPLFTIQSINVQMLAPGKMYSEIPSSLQSKLLSLKGQSLLEVSLNDVMDIAEKDDRVEEARVFRRVPGKLKVELLLKNPAAILLDNKNRKIPVDEQGRKLPALGKGEYVDLPLLRGRMLLNSESRRKELVTFLKEIPEQGKFSQHNISEVWFNKKRGYRFFVSPGGIEVLLGHGLDADKVSGITKVLKYMESKELSGRIIDARFTKKVVVRLRNET